MNKTKIEIMKKMMLFTLALVGLSTISKAQGIFELTKKNGGAKGFDHIKQTTDALGNTKMICEGPGNSKAEFMRPPDDKSKTDINTVILFVDKQIKAGKLSGLAVVDGMLAKWQGTDVYNYKLRAAPEDKQ
jgi:hypothetical protein